MGRILSTTIPNTDGRSRQTKRWRVMLAQFTGQLQTIKPGPINAGDTATLRALATISLKLEDASLAADSDPSMVLKLASAQNRLLRQLGLQPPLPRESFRRADGSSAGAPGGKRQPGGSASIQERYLFQPFQLCAGTALKFLEWQGPGECRHLRSHGINPAKMAMPTITRRIGIPISRVTPTTIRNSYICVSALALSRIS
jgi:hypothetical protein